MLFRSSLAASQLDGTAVSQFKRSNARHLTLPAEVVWRAGGKIEQQSAKKFQQRRLTSFVGPIDDLHSVTGKHEVAVGEVAEAVDVQLPNLHVWFTDL